MLQQLGGFLFRYFVEFELFVLFSFKPTKKPANGSRSTFLGAFGFQIAFECQFFLSINNYTGSYYILLSVFSLLFLPNEIFVVVFDFVAIFSYLFLSLAKKSNYSSKFDSTHSCSISANVLFRKRPLDISILFGISCLLFCHQT